MVSLRSKLPPVNSLVVFEAAARLMNFTRAAQELSVTQAAVSRQIQLLEDHLGTQLFQRQPRALKLTLPGHRLHKAVTMSLEHIANTVMDLRRIGPKADVTVATSVTFASYWLMAHIAKFRAANPEIELKVVASAPVSDLAGAGIDLAIRYGSGKWPGVQAIHLMDNEVFPVCSPDYLAGRKPLKKPRDLLEESLLHLIEYDRNWVTWEAWLQNFGVPWKPAKRGLEFDNYLVLVQGALDGQGIALGGGRLAEDFIARGTLVRPITATLSSSRGFYLLVPMDVPLSQPAKHFRDWIVGEAKGNKKPSSKSVA
jgi:LysR family transcriptional regulator, glycine cleavage system transcriptional activator